MNQLYHYLARGLALLLVVIMMFSVLWAVFSPAEENKEVNISFSGILDGSMYDDLENWYTGNFPGQDFFAEKFADLQDWYTIVDEVRIIE